MIKSYIALNSLHLVTSVVVEKMVIVIEFKGGRITPHGRANGTFTTDNAALQKTIESDSNYGIQFVLHKTGGKKEGVEPSDVPQNSYINIHPVNSRQRAIEWIADNLNIEIPKSINSRGIRHIAQERGFVFENWN